MINEKKVVEMFVNLTKISSPSLKERGVGDFVKKQLQELGFDVIEDNCSKAIGGNCGNIIGVLKGNGKKTLLFSAHMDTVLPCDKVTPIIEDGIIKSDGTTVLGGDDKSGIVSIIEGIRSIIDEKIELPDLVVVFSVAEEIGLLGAKNFEIEKYQPDYSFVLDSSGKPGVVIVQTPYSAKGRVKIIGKPAHAGIAPELGINALEVASHSITKIKLGRIDEETTSNIGVVAGGEAVNIVMPEVRMEYEARSFSENKLDTLLADTQKVFEEECNRFGAQLIWSVEKGYAGYRIDKEEEILKKLKKVCENIEIEYKEQSTGGGSDSNIYNSKGYLTLTLGTGMSKVHTKEEYILIEDLVKTSQLVKEIIKELV